MMSEAPPYKCNICGQTFSPGKYDEYLKHKKEFNH